MNKKLLISLSSLSTIAIVAPVLVITSCTGDTSVNVQDLIITPKTNSKLLQEDITALKGTELSAQLIVLNKLFGGSGLSTENQANFKVTVNENEKIVTLTANSGFTINGKTTLDSNKYEILPPVEITNLIITVIPDVKLTNTDVSALDGSDTTAKWVVLAKLFGGKDFISTNQDKFAVSIDTNNKKITLTAKTGFTIGGQQILTNTFTIDSNPVVPTDLVITATSSPVLTQEEETLLKGTGTNTEKWAVLAKLFGGEGFVPTNQDKFTVSVGDNKVVTLTAVSGYKINGADTFVSNAYTIGTNPTITDLKITAKKSPKLTATEETQLQSGTDAQKQAALGILFDPINADNYKNFTFTLDKDKKTVTLKANTGFIFGDAETLVSNVYTIETNPTTDLKIKPKASPKLTATEETQLESGNDTQKQAALGMLFDPITAENYKNFTFTLDKGNKKVTLTAKSGFIFGTTNTLVSNAYTVETNPTVTDLKITAIKDVKLSDAEVAVLEAQDNAPKWVIFKKLFEGKDFESANQDVKFTITFDKSKLTVTLTAKAGFTIGGQGTLSNTFTVENPSTSTDLKIIAKSGNVSIRPNDLAELEENNTRKLEALKKLFEGEGLTDANLAHFTIEIPWNKNAVTLKANSNYSFSGSPTLEKGYSLSSTVPVTVTVKSPTPTLTSAEINTLKEAPSFSNRTAQLNVLMKVFTGVVDPTIRFFNIEVNEGAKSITLRTKPGFVIGADNTSTTKEITANYN
ncbi:MAG: hypothetical protein ACRC9U_02210 [Metamycoplasmataceae bacterium]